MHEESAEAALVCVLVPAAAQSSGQGAVEVGGLSVDLPGVSASSVLQMSTKLLLSCQGKWWWLGQNELPGGRGLHTSGSHLGWERREQLPSLQASLVLLFWSGGSVLGQPWKGKVARWLWCCLAVRGPVPPSRPVLVLGCLTRGRSVQQGAWCRAAGRYRGVLVSGAGVRQGVRHC